MPKQPRKMSEIMKEMSERLLRNPAAVPSSEAAHIALMFANIAWNESVGIVHAREGYRPAWEHIEAENPAMWDELKSNDVNAMIDELVEYKQRRYADDRRRILACGIPDGSVHVEWLDAAPPGVDPTWQLQLYGLIKMGRHKQAVEFLRKTRGLNVREAEAEVANVALKLGLA